MTDYLYDIQQAPHAVHRGAQGRREEDVGKQPRSNQGIQDLEESLQQTHEG